MSSAASETPAQAPPVSPQGLGGWMILPLIGTCLSPWFLLWGGIQSIPLLSSAAVSADLRMFIIAEIVGNLLLGMIWLWAIVLLFMKKRSYPRMFIIASLGSLFFLGADLLVAALQFQLPLEDRKAHV